MIVVNLSKSVRSPWSEAKVKKIVNQAAQLEKKIRGEVEINIVGDKKIRTLNRLYRGQDKVTDVLAFAWQENGFPTGDHLGQIYLCQQQIEGQARRFKVSSREEFARILIHGLLHLVGYDHLKKADATKMFALQEKILQKCF